MTDKQIIDKLKNDVACKENIINHLAAHNIKLQDQLKLKEQECERLKHDNDYEVGALEKTIDNLKAECDGWKTRSDGWMSKCEQETKLREFVNEQLDQEKADNKKLKQTLASIKEIVEKVYNDCDNCYRDTDTNCDVDCIDCTLGGKAKLAEQILQIISEVEKCVRNYTNVLYTP